MVLRLVGSFGIWFFFEIYLSFARYFTRKYPTIVTSRAFLKLLTKMRLKSCADSIFELAYLKIQKLELTIYQLWFIAYNKFRLSMHSFQLSVIIFISLYRFMNELKFYLFSLVVHPNKLLIATGQTTGHDRREGRVSISMSLIILKNEWASKPVFFNPGSAKPRSSANFYKVTWNCFK